MGAAKYPQFLIKARLDVGLNDRFNSAFLPFSIHLYWMENGRLSQR
jgi:hypothetical protein